ncbi:MAG: helix-turn-helix domain-containing protein [Patescibacteria group bacterium]
MENTQTFEQHLVQAGLSGEQARLYESLVKSGPSPASDAARRAKVSRTLAYKVFIELATLGLVEKREDAGKVALFTAAHPLKLKELIEKREKEAKDALTALEGVLGQMTSEYNIAGGKPGVRFFEGAEGVRKILEDSLTSKTDILQYADVEIIETRFKKENDEYLKVRARRNIAKKLIVIDSDFTRRLYATVTEEAKSEVRAIPKGDAPFDVALMIYDGKISYLTLRAETPIGVIIADQSIYEMHRHLFLTLYAQAAPVQTPHSADSSHDQKSSV